MLERLRLIRLAMSKVDQFESVFKSAAKVVYVHEQPSFASIVVVTDHDSAGAERLARHVREFLHRVDDGAVWHIAEGSQCETVEQLLGLVDASRPNLLVTYRNLHSSAWQWPYSLGKHLDVLTQATDCPVLVIPHPRGREQFYASAHSPGVVMAVTDHLAGDSRLVNYAAALTEPGGTLILTHIEERAAFERYMDVISKIPSIDTDSAREKILGQLLKEPSDYIRRCREVMLANNVPVTVEAVVGYGHCLSEYKRLLAEHEAALLVVNTKDQTQLAMHGMAYALAVELRDIPLLML